MTTNAKAPIVVVGAGYVGLVTAVGLAAKRQVRLVDQNEALIRELERGETRIREDRLEERLTSVRGNLTFHTSVAHALDDREARIVFIAVGTPTKRQPSASVGELPADPEGELPPDPDADAEGFTNADADAAGIGRAADLLAVKDVIDSLLPYRGLAVVMKSTVPPGTGNSMLERAREKGSDLIYLSCPEFLQEGEAFKGFDNPHRIIVGCTKESPATEALFKLHTELYPDLRRRPKPAEGAELPEPSSSEAEHLEHPEYIEMDLTSAEVVKLLSNLHLAMRISYSNEAAKLCEEVGADVTTVMGGVGADHRIGPSFLEPGLGFGGSCFGKDILALSYTADRVDAKLLLAETVLSVNQEQPIRVIRKLQRRGALEGARVAILGLAFKPGTDDLRGSPAFTLADALRDCGASVRAWDPEPRALEKAKSSSKICRGDEKLEPEEIATSAIEAMRYADAVVLVTAWPEFNNIDWYEAAAVLNGKLVVDGRNHLSATAIRAAGLEYEGTGRESRGLGRALPETATEG